MPKRSTLPKYVSEEVDHKTGKVYVYFRRRGRAKVRMTEAPYSEEFNAHCYRSSGTFQIGRWMEVCCIFTEPFCD